ncbi:hypothetical protein LCGC14_0743040 [marine sediment metagenome]|uniref:Right handed beta helix domain-containing protein n=1 Tax=marine sediment metagenome TaxID=412755 RepID=A0A0F9Q654_9ZZZZ
MAIKTYFVSATNGNNANDGLDNVGVGLATATWTDVTFTLTQAGHGYTFAAGDIIYISGGTGATVDSYEVASSTANDIVLVETSTLHRIGNASDFAAGDLATGDITSSDGPWQTIDKAMNVIAAGDDTKVYCRNEMIYSESPIIDTAVTSTTQTCTFEGYGTVLGDDIQITMQGTLLDSIATRIHYCFKNIIFDAEGANVNAVSLASYEIMFRKCKFINATGIGANCAQSTWFWDCDFNDNDNDGCVCGNGSAFFNCRFYRNATAGIDCSGTLICWNCTFFSNAGNAIDGGTANETHLIVINCTIDGDSKDTTRGVSTSAATRGMVAIINSIVYDCLQGDNVLSDRRDLLLNDLYNENTTDHTGSGSDQEGTFASGAPDFVDEVAGADYTLNSGSPAVSAGHDEDDNMDIGSHQRPAGGAGGGMIVHPGTSGGARA